MRGLPALAGATAVIVFLFALFGTRAALSRAGTPAQGTREPVAASMPAIAYSTATSLNLRRGTGPVRTLARFAPGTVTGQLVWSSNHRWLGWFSGQRAGITQVHVSDLTTGVTHTWACTGCVAGAFQGDHLLTGSNRVRSLTAYPATGGAPATITPPALKTTHLIVRVLGSTPHDAAALLFSGNPIPSNDLRLYRVTTAGNATLVAHLPNTAALGGDRAPEDTTLFSTSPDGKILAYGGNILGGDPGEASDSVTVVNLQTFAHSTVGLPKDRAQPLRLSAVWVNSSDQVFASAWHQPGNQLKSGGIPSASLVPDVYQLVSGHWVPTGAVTPQGSGGQAGWTATIANETLFSTATPRGSSDLIASYGATRIKLASHVTSFSWEPAE